MTNDQDQQDQNTPPPNSQADGGAGADSAAPTGDAQTSPTSNTPNPSHAGQASTQAKPQSASQQNETGSGGGGTAKAKSRGKSSGDSKTRAASGKASAFFSQLFDRVTSQDYTPWLAWGGRWFDLIQRDLRQACGLLTGLPLPHSATATIAKDTPPRFYWSFPLVGVIVAGLAVAPLLILAHLPIPNFLLAASVFLLAAFLTRGLHEDGLADLADSLGGQSPKARFAIMRDSRLGTFGVLALVIIVVVHIGGLTVMIDRGMLGGFVAAAAISRAMMVLQAWMHPPASDASHDDNDLGLAASMGQPSQTVMLVSLATATLVSFLFSGGLATFLAVLLGLVVTFVMGIFTRAHLGGVNGDALGATQQITSALAMIVMVASG